MVLACVVRGCTNKTGNAEQGVSYHIFPKDQTRRKQWTEALALYNWTPAKKSVVCSKHFLDTHFVNDLSRNRKLTHSAVPCIIPKPDFDMRRDETPLQALENALQALSQKADYVNGLMSERKNLQSLTTAPAAQYANHVNALMAERKILQSQTKPPGDQSTNTVNSVKTKRKKLKSKVTEVPAAKYANHVNVKPALQKPSLENEELMNPSSNLFAGVPASLIDPPSHRLLYSVTGNHIRYQTLTLRTPSPWSRAGTYEKRGFYFKVEGTPRRSICPLAQPTYVLQELDPWLYPAAQSDFSDSREVPSDKLLLSYNDKDTIAALRFVDDAQADHYYMLQTVTFEETQLSPDRYNTKTRMSSDNATQADSPDVLTVPFEKTLSPPKNEDPRIIKNDELKADLPESQAVTYKNLSSAKSEDPTTIFDDAEKTNTFVFQAVLYENSILSPKSKDLKIFFNDAVQTNSTYIPQAVPYENRPSSPKSDDLKIFFNDAVKVKSTYVPRVDPFERKLSPFKSEDLNLFFKDATQVNATYIPQMAPYHERSLLSPDSEKIKAVRSDADDDSPRKVLLKQEITSLKEKNKLLEKIVELLEYCKRLDKKHIAYLKESILFNKAEKRTFIPEEDKDYCSSTDLPENDYFYLGL